MLKSVQWVHADGRLQSSSPGGSEDFRVTGDCGGIKATYSNKQLRTTKIRGRAWVRGTSHINGKTTRLSAHIIVIASKYGQAVAIKPPKA